MSAYVDFEEVITEAVGIVGLSGDDELAKNFARQWVWRGLQKLGSSDEQLEVCQVDVKNLPIRKPKMKRFDDIAMFDVNACLFPHVFTRSEERRVGKE